MVWAPHGHDDAVDALLALSQVVLLDSVDGDDVAEALGRAHSLSEQAYVVDLAWLRSTPWRERVAATFDPAAFRPQLRTISGVTIRHHPESGAAGLLLVGWLASRLGWETSALRDGHGALHGEAHAGAQGRRDPPRAGARADGPGPGFARARDGRVPATAHGPRQRRPARPLPQPEGHRERVDADGASRGESGILGEGIRQALLRDPTYAPALAAAETMAG